MSSLSNGDKQRLAFPGRHQDRLIQGRFKTTKTASSDTPGTDSLKRCLLGQGSGPAQWPQTSRLVEAICIQLCCLHPSPTSLRLVEKITLQLFELNQHTLSQWHNKRQKGQEQAVLQQGVAPPSASAVDPEPQPQSHPLLQEGMTYGHQPHVFSMPPKHRGTGKAAETPWGHGTDRSWTTRPHPT